LHGDKAAAAVGGLAGQVGLDTNAMAEGITRIAVVNMTGAIKEISVMRGLDPRDFALMAYGGAGPLHATAIAEELGMTRVLVPPMPANFSAFGLLVADLRRDFVRTRVTATAGQPIGDVRVVLSDLAEEGRRELEAAGFGTDRQRFEASLDMRYLGQAFELSVPIPFDVATIDEIDAAFRRVYADRYGDAPDGGSEIVNYRLTACGVTDKPALPALEQAGRSRDAAAKGDRPVVFGGTAMPTGVYERGLMPLDDAIAGPALIEEPGSVTVVPPDWSARLTANDCLVLERNA
jgi:N-methylhydantoinase A